MTIKITNDEMKDELIETEKWLSRVLKLLGVELKDGRYVSISGEPYGRDKKEAIQQDIVRSHELVRLRQKIWSSDLPDEEKVVLVRLLNYVVRFINLYLVGEDDQEKLTENAEGAAFLLGGLCNLAGMSE